MTDRRVVRKVRPRDLRPGDRVAVPWGEPGELQTVAATLRTNRGWVVDWSGEASGTSSVYPASARLDVLEQDRA